MRNVCVPMARLTTREWRSIPVARVTSAGRSALREEELQLHRPFVGDAEDRERSGLLDAVVGERDRQRAGGGDHAARQTRLERELDVLRLPVERQLALRRHRDFLVLRGNPAEVDWLRQRKRGGGEASRLDSLATELPVAAVVVAL